MCAFNFNYDFLQTEILLSYAYLHIEVLQKDMKNVYSNPTTMQHIKGWD